MNTTLQFLQSQKGKDASQSPSPLMRWLNPTILNADIGKIELQLLVREEMCNPLGKLHGGISSAIIDDTIGVAMFSYGEQSFYSSINLSVDFFSSVKLNEEILIKAEVLKKGKKLSNAFCEIFQKNTNRLVARGTSNLLTIEI